MIRFLRFLVIANIVVDTPRSQVVSGKIAASALKLSRATFEIETDEATVALTSLDGLPLERSVRILLSALGRACPEPGKPPVYRTEPILGTIQLRREGPPLVLRSLLVSEASPTPLGKESTDEGSLRVPLRAGSHWYLLSPPDNIPAGRK
ncbi:MAG: hypothetical protein GY937_22430 [bacterium]|nr:hypothetical protein [bacterium]